MTGTPALSARAQGSPKGGQSARTREPQPVEHLYIHVPFCARICPFCAFYVQRLAPGVLEGYVGALLLEWKRQRERFWVEPKTIYLGGGTPSLLPLELFRRLAQGIGFREAAEVTLEAHPASVTKEKLLGWRRLGINRLSLGMQSFDKAELQWLGRPDDPEHFPTVAAWARKAGFKNLNFDLLFGLPGQTEARWQKTLEQAIRLRPEHLSVYCLTIEEGTPLEKAYREGKFCRDPGREADLWLLADRFLVRNGWLGYEISNYAFPGFRCRHNEAYWIGKEYLGLGPSAWSTVGEERWQNVPDTQRYLRAIEAGESPIGWKEVLAPELRRKERVLFGLRRGAGVPGVWLHQEEEKKLRFWAGLGLVEHRLGRYRLSLRGKLLADELAAELL
jgi:oxygen-independent coproporphyrinogen-3 oxidase